MNGNADLDGLKNFPLILRGVHEKMYKNTIIQMLKAALADELNAVYQYWVQSKLVHGFHKEAVVKELLQHKSEEMEHADMLMNRILELGGNPEIRPIDWDRHTKCRYNPTIDRDLVAILDDAIAGEKCATEHYNEILRFVKNKDTTTYIMIQKIINDEFEHIRDLNKLKQEILQHLPANENNEEEENGK